MTGTTGLKITKTTKPETTNLGTTNTGSINPETANPTLLGTMTGGGIMSPG